MMLVPTTILVVLSASTTDRDVTIARIPPFQLAPLHALPNGRSEPGEITPITLRNAVSSSTYGRLAPSPGCNTLSVIASSLEKFSASRIAILTSTGSSPTLVTVNTARSPDDTTSAAPERTVPLIPTGFESMTGTSAGGACASIRLGGRLIQTREITVIAPAAATHRVLILRMGSPSFWAQVSSGDCIPWPGGAEAEHFQVRCRGDLRGGVQLYNNSEVRRSRFSLTAQLNF